MLTGIIIQDNTVILSDDGYPIIESYTNQCCTNA